MFSAGYLLYRDNCAKSFTYFLWPKAFGNMVICGSCNQIRTHLLFCVQTQSVCPVEVKVLVWLPTIRRCVPEQPANSLEFKVIVVKRVWCNRKRCVRRGWSVCWENCTKSYTYFLQIKPFGNVVFGRHVTNACNVCEFCDSFWLNPIQTFCQRRLRSSDYHYCSSFRL